MFFFKVGLVLISRKGYTLLLAWTLPVSICSFNSLNRCLHLALMFLFFMNSLIIMKELS